MLPRLYIGHRLISPEQQYGRVQRGKVQHVMLQFRLASCAAVLTAKACRLPHCAPSQPRPDHNGAWTPLYCRCSTEQYQYHPHGLDATDTVVAGLAHLTHAVLPRRGLAPGSRYRTRPTCHDWLDRTVCTVQYCTHVSNQSPRSGTSDESCVRSSSPRFICTYAVSCFDL